MLKLDKVEKHYKDFELLCSMEVKPGCVTGLIGKNGAGKSTVFKAILGLIKIDAGQAEIFNKKPGEITEKEKEQIGVVLADSGFSGYLTISDLLPVLECMYEKFNRNEFTKQCNNFSLPLDKQIRHFSTGMKRKLQILTALSHDAKFLILDEPTAGLDVTAREEILNMLREYMEEENRSILISSHISSDLEGFCDDIYMIQDGKIVLHEDTDVLLDEYALLKVTEEQYSKLEQKYILRRKKEKFGYSLLTDQKAFFKENYPEIILEKGSIDDVISMMSRGETL